MVGTSTPMTMLSSQGILTPYSDDGLEGLRGIYDGELCALRRGRRSLHGWGKRSNVMGYPTGTFAVHNGHTKLKRSWGMDLIGAHS